MPSADPLCRKRWFDCPDTLIRVGLSTLASTFLIVLAPQVGTILLEIFVALLLVIRAFVLRARWRRVSQLCLEFRSGSGAGMGRLGSRIRFLDRYELLLIAAVILTYGSLSGFLRARGLPDGLVRIIPLVMFGIGLLAKPRILGWIANRRKAGGVSSGQCGANQG